MVSAYSPVNVHLAALTRQSLPLTCLQPVARVAGPPTGQSVTVKEVQLPVAGGVTYTSMLLVDTGVPMRVGELQASREKSAGSQDGEQRQS